jgi:tetratricopeptide (TPR) repeat protein
VLERLLTVDPRAYEAYGELALLRSNLGEWDAAIAAARGAVEVMPDYSEGWRRLSEAHRKKGDLAKAQAALDDGLTVVPGDPVLRHQRAILWKEAGDEDAAEAELRENINVNPGHLDSYETLGDLWQSQERFAEADSLHLLIAERWPKLPKAQRIVGGYFFERKEFERAEPYYRRAIEDDATFLWVRYRLATCLYELERTDEARAELADIERIWPEDAEAARRIASLNRSYEKNLEAAEQWYLRGLASVPGDPRLLRELASLYREQARYPEAAELLEQILVVNPRDHEVLTDLAWVRMQLGDLDAAVNAADAALEVRPDYPDAMLTLGDALSRSGQRHQAAAVYEKLLEVSSGNEKGYALGSLGNIYLQEGRFQRAIEMWKQANAIHGHPEAWRKVTWTSWWFLSDANGARFAYDELMKSNPRPYDLAYAHVTLAAIAEESGNRAGADSLYAEAERKVDELLDKSPKRPGYVLVGAYLHALRGHEERARELLGVLIVGQDGSASHQREIATVLAILGDYGAAFEHLEKAFELGLDTTAVIEADRNLRELREDPRFAALMERFG